MQFTHENKLIKKMYRVDIRQWFLFRRYLVQNTLLKIKPKPMDKYLSIQGFISDERIEKKNIMAISPERCGDYIQRL